MTDQQPRDPGTPAASTNASPGPPGVDAAVVTGLAREIEAARRDIDRLRALAERVDDLAGDVARLADTFTPSTVAAPEGVASWLDFPAEPGRDAESSRAARDADELLTALAAWVGGVCICATRTP